MTLNFNPSAHRRVLLETQTEKGERKLSGNFLLPLLPVLMEGEKQLLSDAEGSGYSTPVL